MKIFPEDDYVSLLPKLAEVGAKLLLSVLDEIEAKGFENVKRRSQNHAQATFVKMIEKEDGLLDFSQDAKILENKVRAFCDSPVAYFFVGGERIKVLKARALSKDEIENNFPCVKNQILNEKKQKNAKNAADLQNFGQILCAKKRFVISAKNGALDILRCQAPGGKVLDATAFLNGFHFKGEFVDDFVTHSQGEARA